MNKKKILLLIIVVTIIIAIIFFYRLRPKEIKVPKKNENEYVTNSNDNSGIIESQTVSGLKISNIMLVVEEKGSTFTADVTNITNEVITGNLKIKFKTSTDKEVTSILGYFGGSIEPGKTKQIISNTSRQLKKNIIKSVEYELNL